MRHNKLCNYKYRTVVAQFIVLCSVAFFRKAKVNTINSKANRKEVDSFSIHWSDIVME